MSMQYTWLWKSLSLVQYAPNIVCKSSIRFSKGGREEEMSPSSNDQGLKPKTSLNR